MKNIYQKHGYKNREDYLQSLADEYGLELYIVQMLADSNGEGEDFDGLVTMLKDEFN